MANCTTEFNLEDYLKKLKLYLQNIMKKPKSDVIPHDILDTEKRKNSKHQLHSLNEHQNKMDNGQIWQFAVGNYEYFVDLRIGHKTGLDCLSTTRKIALELKNRSNTDNSSSRKTNLDKLAKFKKENPEYTCIYGNINGDTEEKTNNIEPEPPTNAVLKNLCREHGLRVNGNKEQLVKRLKDKNIDIPYKNNIIIHDGVEIQKLVGYKLLNFIFGENTEKIVQFIKDTLDEIFDEIFDDLSQ